MRLRATRLSAIAHRSVRGGFVPILDQLGITAAAAYSLRQLSLAASLADRVRRSTDNAEANVGFTPSGDLNAADLLNYCGAGSGFGTIWYDQSGSGRNALKTTPVAQPRIVNAGVLEISNGKPAFRLNGSSAYFGGVSLPLSEFTLICVLNDVTQLPTIRYPIGTGSASPGRGIFSSFSGFSGFPPANATLGYTPDAGGVVQTGFLPTIGQSYVVSLTTTATASSIWVNGGNNATGGRITLNQLFIGQRGDNLWYYDGYNLETIVFPSALSTADRQLVERNMGAYYGIAVA